MKKFTFMMMGLFLALSMSAQPAASLFATGHETAAPAMGQNRVVSDDVSLEPVTPPDGLVTASYRLNTYLYISSWTSISRSILIGFDGNDVYLQGFSYYFPEAWIKGTLSDDHSTVSFPLQYFGDMENTKGETRHVYFCPFTFATGEDGETYRKVIDAVFNYNEDLGTFVLDQDVITYIFEATEPDASSYFAAYDTYIAIASDEDTVKVPSGLETTTYEMAGTYMDLDDDDAWIDGEPYVGSVKVAVQNDTIYIQGLCQYLPDAWVKGERQGDAFVVKSGQYFGVLVSGGKGYPIYFVAYDAQTDEATDLKLTYDEETDQYTAGQWVSLSATGGDMLAYEVYSNVTFSAIPNVAAVPATPRVKDFYADDEMAAAEFDVPLKDVDGHSLLPEYLAYQVLVDYGEGPEAYVFSADWHAGLDEDTDILPYLFENNDDILAGGEMIFFYEIESGLQRIGLQSIYYGGGEEHRSDIGWYVVDEETVGVASASTKEPVATVYYDLQGRRVADGQAHGLLLKQTRAADGTVKTVKVAVR